MFAQLFEKKRQLVPLRGLLHKHLRVTIIVSLVFSGLAFSIVSLPAQKGPFPEPLFIRKSISSGSIFLEFWLIRLECQVMFIVSTVTSENDHPYRIPLYAFAAN